MPIMASDNKKKHPPTPEGLHPAVCVDVVDLGMQTTEWGLKHKVRIVWQVEDEYADESGKYPPRRFTPMATYNLSLNEKATLRKHLEAWRGRKFTGDELKGFDLEKLITAPCQLQIVHNIGTDGTVYGNVSAIVPLGKGMTRLAAKDYVRVQDREDAAQPAGEPEPDSEVPF